MVKMGKKGLKILKLVHIILSAIWLGVVISMLALAFTEDFGVIQIAVQDTQSASLILKRTILLPSFGAMMLTGLVYGFFTKWGFLKSTWIILKWVLSFIFMALVNALEFNIITGCILLGIIGLIFICSVFKPNPKRKTTNNEAVTNV